MEVAEYISENVNFQTTAAPVITASACTVKAVAVRKGKLDSCITGLTITMAPDE